VKKPAKDRRTPAGQFTKHSAAHWGAIGGRKRRTTLTPAERSAIARRAGLARHGLSDDTAA